MLLKITIVLSSLSLLISLVGSALKVNEEFLKGENGMAFGFSLVFILSFIMNVMWYILLYRVFA